MYFPKDENTAQNDKGLLSIIFSISYCRKKCADGEIVKKGETIAERESKDILTQRIIKTAIKSPISGRVFFICEDRGHIEDGAAIAIISDKEDTRKNVLKWYDENKKMEDNESAKKDEVL